MTNAAKFSLRDGKATPVRVSAALEPPEAAAAAAAPKAAGRPWLVLRVADRGRGMAPDEAASCFEAGKAAAAAAGGGTGLGLYSACASFAKQLLHLPTLLR